MNCSYSRAKIIVGSESKFSIFLTDENDVPYNLTSFTQANLVFLGCDGTRTVVDAGDPSSYTNPGSGEVPVTAPATKTALADKNWVSADLELIRDDETQVLVVLKDKFEIQSRVAPPSS